MALRVRWRFHCGAARAQTQTEQKPRVFVAGASGKTGVRTVRQLANDGSASVVAGVREPERAERIFRGKEVPKGYEYTGASDTTPEPIDLSNVTIAKVDVVSEEQQSVASHLNGVDAVISCLGPRESQPFDPSLPKKVDADGTQNLICAAEDAGVKHFVLVTSLGTGRFGWPAAALNLFWFAV